MSDKIKINESKINKEMRQKRNKEMREKGIEKACRERFWCEHPKDDCGEYAQELIQEYESDKKREKRIRRKRRRFAKYIEYKRNRKNK
jgi:hypothetical protein